MTFNKKAAKKLISNPFLTPVRFSCSIGFYDCLIGAQNSSHKTFKLYNYLNLQIPGIRLKNRLSLEKQIFLYTPSGH